MEEKKSLVDAFADIDAYLYRYNRKAHALYPDGEKGVDDKAHIGVMAQELQKNPITSAAVEMDSETGYLIVDTRQLCLTLCAVMSEMAKEIQDLKAAVFGTI